MNGIQLSSQKGEVEAETAAQVQSRLVPQDWACSFYQGRSSQECVCSQSAGVPIQLQGQLVDFEIKTGLDPFLCKGS